MTHGHPETPSPEKLPPASLSRARHGRFGLASLKTDAGRPVADARQDDGRRNASIEALRYVGAVGIVWFHLDGPVAWLGYVALDVFVMLSVFFALQAGTAWTNRRVLHVWLFWSGVYALMKVAQAVVEGASISDEFEWWMILTGPSLPLWYLPFIFVISGAAVTYVQRTTPRPIWEGALFGAISAGLGLATPLLQVPFAEWSVGLSAMAGALAVFRAMQGHWVVLLIWAALVLVSQDAPLILAVAVTMAALLVSAKTEARWIYALGSLSLPVYVLHSGISSATGLDGTVPNILLVVALSTAIGAVLLRTPVLKSFV